jgi:hypothetical protein
VATVFSIADYAPGALSEVGAGALGSNNASRPRPSALAARCAGFSTSLNERNESTMVSVEAWRRLAVVGRTSRFHKTNRWRRYSEYEMRPRNAAHRLPRTICDNRELAENHTRRAT